jgi:DNA repair photolyase
MNKIVVTKKLAKNIITKSNLPESDFVINPYTGCSHGCIYCYARFMKRFSGHDAEEWGEFVDAKINSPELIPQNLVKYKNKVITIGSVTDPYQEVEKDFKLTRSILTKLTDIEAEINILTKSDLIVRDIDLLKKFKNLKVAISLASLDDEIIKLVEKKSVMPEARLKALEELHQSNIYTILFVSPILPYLTDWQKIIAKTKNYVDEYWFENLNFYPSIQSGIFSALRQYQPELVVKYQDIYFKRNDYWDEQEKMIEKYCQDKKINYNIFFHHSKE